MEKNKKVTINNNAKLRKKILNEIKDGEKRNYKTEYLKKNYLYVYDNAKKEFNSFSLTEALSDTLLYFLVLTGNLKEAKKYLRKVYDSISKAQPAKDLFGIIFENRDRIVAQIRSKKYENINKNFVVLENDSNQINAIKSNIQKLFKDFHKSQNSLKIQKIEEISATLSFISRNLLYIRNQGFGNNQNAKWPHSFNSEFWQNQGYLTGYIYVLSNLYMPGLVKIGVTQNEAIKRANALSRGKLEKDKILNFLFKEYEYMEYPEIVAKTLSRVTGVPGDFNLEYYRKTLIKFPMGKNSASIEEVIHHELILSLQNKNELFEENFSYDLFHKEFFTVPSTKYAIFFVEKMLDEFDFQLKQLELKHITKHCTTDRKGRAAVT